MRKVILVDATFLTTTYRGALIVATAQDGNRHQFPLAWGVVDGENDASWTWFMSRLEEIIHDGPELVIIYDRHQSIANAVREVYKRADHGYCARHMYTNIRTMVNKGKGKKGKKGDTAAGMFYKCAEAYTLSEFQQVVRFVFL